MADQPYTDADACARLAEASKSPEDFWLVYRTLMAAYESSGRVAHMTAFADEAAALAVSALSAAGRDHTAGVAGQPGHRHDVRCIRDDRREP